MKYKVGGSVIASTFIGEYDANSPEEAMAQASRDARVGVCHQCARHISDPEIGHLWAEDETGDLTSEPIEHDQIVALQKQLKEAEAKLAATESLLLWAGKPGYHIWMQGTDCWHAMNDEGELFTAETAAELAGELGLGKATPADAIAQALADAEEHGAQSRPALSPSQEARIEERHLVAALNALDPMIKTAKGRTERVAQALADLEAACLLESNK